ncbi:arginine--tRNA ligase [Methanogenium sp. MK-MG]|uniref:arginine--tRNA ligase n=1 Tax=Methanogenium sp. MK-MG TaxID=2599926 RepID=UPI0013ECFB9B|nr:arginine--tRNA ligase [Methanogenium sp. MK-MG]KAF1078937.1 Arginine--tRNA ligase [Methanogenium sp. MK-MG]
MYQEAYRAVETVLKDATGATDVLLGDGGEHADLASTIAFALAKTEKKSPVLIAGEITAAITDTLAAAGITVSTTGPYINFIFGPAYVAGVVKAASRPGYGCLAAVPGRVCIEHTSANPNGPLHVGHIRNSVIGDTLSRVFRKAGYDIDVQYYLNDMGRQIAIVSWGFDHLDIPQNEDEKDDHYVARVYVAANHALKADPSIKEEIDRRMGLIEQGDPETVEKFRRAVSLCAEGIKVTLNRLGAPHDRFVWESGFVQDGSMVEILDRVEALPESSHDDILAVDLTAFGFEKEYVLRRSDGTSVYAARDLAYHVWKGEHFDRLINVLGADHKLIGAQLQATMKLLGEKVPEIVFFEFVSLPEGSMSTRAGKFISADELIDEVTKKAFDEVTIRRPELPEEERRAIAVSVAIGAVRYDIVRVSQEKSTVFDWRQALDFERQSAPYIQYSHARACSILEKAGEFTPAYEFTTESEIALAKQIGLFPVVLRTVVNELRPHHLAIYARDLADLFNTFYHTDPVLKAEAGVRDARLTLVRAAQNTLSEVLETLGIDAIRSM